MSWCNMSLFCVYKIGDSLQKCNKGVLRGRNLTRDSRLTYRVLG